MTNRKGEGLIFGALALSLWLAIPVLSGVIGWRWGAEWGQAVDRSACAALIPEVRGLRAALEESTVIRPLPLRQWKGKKQLRKEQP